MGWGGKGRWEMGREEGGKGGKRRRKEGKEREERKEGIAKGYPLCLIKGLAF